MLLLFYLKLLQQRLPLLVDLVNKSENRYFNLVLHLLVSLSQLLQPELQKEKKVGNNLTETAKENKKGTIHVGVLQVGLLTCIAPE